MPMHARCNFCEQGFGFAGKMHREGVSAMHFTPGTVWFGTCTAKQHTQTCLELFHKKEFVLPQSACLNVFDEACVQGQTKYVHNVFSLEHLGLIAKTRPGLVRKRVSALTPEHVRAIDLRRLIKHGAMPSAVFVQWHARTKDEADSENKYVLSVYSDWIVHKRKMPCNFHHKVFVSACLAVRHLPPELATMVLKHAFLGKVSGSVVL